MSEVTITRKGEQRLTQGHLWIYRSDIVARGKEPSAGAIVRVRNLKGQPLGRAFYSTKSQIALRMLTLADEPVERDFWRARLQEAAALRARVVQDAEAYRLVHGEGDLIPSLVVDRYLDCLVVQMLSQATAALRPVWIELLQEL